MKAKLPKNWESAPLGDVCKKLKGKKPKNSGKVSKDRTIPYINIKAFETGLPVEYAEPGDYPECSKDDVLIVWDGARSGLTGRGVAGYIGSTLSKIWSDIIDNGYLYYFLQSQYDFINTNTKGVGILHVDPNVLFTIDFPIAPKNEQKRIVAELEKQFSRLDEAVENLKRVKANLKRYKASVLKAAVEGKLTEEWRKKHPDVEPADKLLERILAERRKNWEESESAKIKKAGNKPKDDKWKKKYKEPEKPSEFYLDLPTRWIEVRAEQICDFITKGTTPKANKLYSDKGEIPFIKVYNLTNTGRLDFSIKPTFISNDTNENELARSRVYPGDVLMNIVGPPLGKVSVIPNSFGEGNINQAIAIFRAMPSFNNLLLSYFLLSDTILSWAERRAKATAGQFNLTLEICRNLPIPVPPAEEQITIFKILDQLFTCIDELSNITDKNLKRAERLCQSVLKKAFSGKLILSKES